MKRRTFLTSLAMLTPAVAMAQHPEHRISRQEAMRELLDTSLKHYRRTLPAKTAAECVRTAAKFKDPMEGVELIRVTIQRLSFPTGMA